MNQRIQLASLDDQRNAEAREKVRQRISWPANLTPANVTYHSRGHALLLGCERDTRQAARTLRAWFGVIDAGVHRAQRRRG